MSSLKGKTPRSRRGLFARQANCLARLGRRCGLKPQVADDPNDPIDLFDVLRKAALGVEQVVFETDAYVTAKKDRLNTGVELGRPDRAYVEDRVLRHHVDHLL